MSQPTLNPALNKKSPRVISVSSGKGGVGKTFTSVHLAAHAASSGQKVLLIDADLGLANVDIMLGLNASGTMRNLLTGDATLEDLIVSCPQGFDVLPGGSGLHELTSLSVAEQQTILDALREAGSNYDLILIDMGEGKNRLGCSALAQVYGVTGEGVADVNDPVLLKAFFAAVQRLNRNGLLLAYHDRSDGGLFACIAEMAFAARTGLDICLDHLGGETLSVLFSEELGAVIQVRRADCDRVLADLADAGLSHVVHRIGQPVAGRQLRLFHRGETVFQRHVQDLQQIWSENSFRMQQLRDHPDCAMEAFAAIANRDDAGLQADLSFDPAEDNCSEAAAPYLKRTRPRMAVLREQGVNGQIEMAAAFDRAGFDCIDVHMTDIIEGRVKLDDVQGLVACGGFSFGDVLGAGRGWALSILHNGPARDQFENFFHRSDTFALGVCNGCQMMSSLKSMVPGAEQWPDFKRNRSEQFEARLLQVEVLDSPSIFLSGMAGSKLPLVVAHGEGRAVFDSGQQRENVQTALCYLGPNGKA
ncbi:MAG: phosphoribosylformylglycinamidine synthase subunit PurQ, partial [Mariprofundus sp.]